MIFGINRSSGHKDPPVDGGHTGSFPGSGSMPGGYGTAAGKPGGSGAAAGKPHPGDRLVRGPMTPSNTAKPAAKNTKTGVQEHVILTWQANGNTVICPVCDAENDAGARVCIVCRAVLSKRWWS